MASNSAQLQSSDDVQADIKQLWHYKTHYEPVKRVGGKWVNNPVDHEYIEKLWWVIQRLQFRINELEHPEQYVLHRH